MNAMKSSESYLSESHLVVSRLASWIMTGSIVAGVMVVATALVNIQSTVDILTEPIGFCSTGESPPNSLSFLPDGVQLAIGIILIVKARFIGEYFAGRFTLLTTTG